MKQKNKNILLFLNAGILISSLTGLISCKENDQIVIWARNKNVDALKAGIQTYKNEVDPKFNARIESFARADIDKKFQTASQINNFKSIGDVVLCDGMNIQNYYSVWSKVFTDLSEYVTEDEKSQLVSSTLPIVSINNKLIGLPLDVAPTVVFANRKLWREEDLQKVKTQGWTWSDYMNIGKSIKSSKGNEVTMASYNMRTDDRIYRTMVSQKGEWLTDLEGNIYLGNNNSVEAMTTIKNLFDEGVIGHIDTGDYKSLMKNNKIAAQIQGFFLGGQLKDVAPEMSGEWEILPLPKWQESDKTSASITGGSYLYANSKLEGHKKEDAISFIKWMTLNKSTSMQSLKVGGVYPALRTSYDEEYFKETKDPYFSNEQVWKNVANWSSDAKAIIANKNFNFNYDAFIKAQEKILFTNEYESIEKELLNAAKEIRDNAK